MVFYLKLDFVSSTWRMQLNQCEAKKCLTMVTLAETASDFFQVYISKSKNQKAKTYSHFEKFRNRLWLIPI